MNYEVSEEFKGAPNQPITLEGEIVQFADWIAYINHDIDDAINMGLLKGQDLPREPVRVLGNSHAKRIDTMVKSIIEQGNYLGRNKRIQMSPEVMKATTALRAFLFRDVYTLPVIAGEEKNASEILTKLFEYYRNDFDLVVKEMPWIKKLPDYENNQARFVIDFLASLTDARAQELYNQVG